METTAQQDRAVVWTSLGRRVGWALAAGLALWPLVISYMIVYAPEESGLDFEPPESVFWLFILTSLVLTAPAWRAARHGRRAAGGARAGWWLASIALWLSAAHHLVLGWVALLVSAWVLW